MRNDSCILVVTNLAANEINSVCTNLFSGESTVCYSADSVFDSEDDCRYPVEFLNSLSVPGLPDHILNLKTGMPVILLRNLCPKSGLCNGVRLIVKAVLNKRLVAVHFSNRESTETMLIPRISLVVDETASVPLKWKRRQFPLKPAFSLTINKVQGQTLSRVAVWLEVPVFSHGQLYTAASRINDPNNIRFYVPPDDVLPETLSTRNVVFDEVLD